MLGCGKFLTGQLSLPELAVAFGHFEVSLGKGELGAYGDFRVVILLGKRFDLPVRALADRHKPDRRLDAIGIIIPRPDSVPIDDGEALALDVVAFRENSGLLRVAEGIGSSELATVRLRLVEGDAPLRAGFCLEEEGDAVRSVRQVGPEIRNIEVEGFPCVRGGDRFEVLFIRDLEDWVRGDFGGSGKPFIIALCIFVGEPEMDVSPRLYDQAADFAFPHPLKTRFGCLLGACLLLFGGQVSMFRKNPGDQWNRKTERGDILFVNPRPYLASFVVLAEAPAGFDDFGGVMTKVDPSSCESTRNGDCSRDMDTVTFPAATSGSFPSGIGLEENLDLVRPPQGKMGGFHFEKSDLAMEQL